MFSLLPDVVVQFLDGHGKPLAGGLIYTYESGTTTLKPTFADPEGKTPNTNPIVLDAAGRAKIYLDTGAYRVRILSRDGVLITDTNQVSRFVNNVELAEVLKTVNDGLSDLANVSEALESLVDEIFRNEKGLANGIAPLDGDGQIPVDYLQNIQHASMTQHGLIKIASDQEVQQGLDDENALTSKKLTDLFATQFKDVLSIRAADTIYKNTGKRWRIVVISVVSRTSDVTPKCELIFGAAKLVFTQSSLGAITDSKMALVPPNTEYKLQNPMEILSWAELDL